MSGSIRPYKDKDGKYKVGVAMSLCMYCGDPSGVTLGGKEVDEIGHKGAVFSSEPCEKCKDYMKQGIMICETENGQDENSNPVRTGRLVVIKEESFREHFNMPDTEKSKRFFYMEHAMFEQMFGEQLKKEHESDPANQQEKPE